MRWSLRLEPMSVERSASLRRSSTDEHPLPDVGGDLVARVRTLVGHGTEAAERREAAQTFRSHPDRFPEVPPPSLLIR